MTGRRALAIVALLVVPAPARASGFFLYEQSAAAMAKGSAMVASARDPSAAWFNPAALAFVSDTGASLNTSLLSSAARFSPKAGGGDTVAPGTRQLIPALFGHVPLGDRWTLSLAVLAPFGLKVAWPSNWVGREESLSTSVTVIGVNPSLAWRLSDYLSLAAGVSLLHGTVDLQLGLPELLVGGGAGELRGTAWGLSGNVALLWRPLPERLAVGFTYRSRSRLPFRGQADFVVFNAMFKDSFPKQGVSANTTLPDALALGLAWRPHPRLELSLQVDWVLWSTFDHVVLDFERDNMPPDRIFDRGAIDPLTGRLGLEWAVAPRWSWRVGGSFDQSSSRASATSAAAPDGHRVGVGTGLGWTLGRMTVDISYFYAYFLPTVASGPDAHPEGTYRSYAHVFALTIGVGGGGPLLRDQ